MTHLKQFAGGLLALGISAGLQASASAADTSPAFRILTPEEVATHTAAMAALHGTAREDYRNAQYEQLKIRAREQGFRMPPTPPWAATAATPVAAAMEMPVQPDQPAAAEAPAATPPAEGSTDAAARHAAMREKMQAHLEAMQPAAESAPQAAGQEPLPQVQQPASAPAAAVPSDPAFAPVAAASPEPAEAAQPPSPPSPAPQEASTNATPAGAELRFAPVEEAAMTPLPPPAASDQAPEVAASPESAAPQAMGAGIATAGGESQPYAGSDAMTAYRETMRSRFDEYMKERQAQLQETAKRQREQHEAEMERQRALQADRSRFQPYPYPAMPAYGPRYPEAFPGYRTPYWQQR